jgi:hypothetical protein
MHLLSIEMGEEGGMGGDLMTENGRKLLKIVEG